MTDIATVLQHTLDELIDSGDETGLQAAVYLQGELVADCTAGVVGPETDEPVRSDTLLTIFSASKAVISTAFHILSERGLFEYDRPVADYWPEFAVAGKKAITIAQVMNHTAGIPQTPELPDVPRHKLWSDSARMIAETEKLAPIFEPGSTSCYHGLTMGWVLDGLVRRVDGRTMGQVVRDEIAVPLGIEDELFLGTPSSVFDRMATVYDAPIDPADLPEFDPDSILFKVLPPGDETLGTAANRPEFRSGEVPAGGISSSARALARHYAAMVGPVDGCQLLSGEHFTSMFDHACSLPDQFMNAQFSDELATPRVLGYQRSTGDSSELFFYGPSQRAIGHEGYGGAVGLVDPDRKLSLGFTKNLLHSFIKDETTGKLRTPSPNEMSKTRVTKVVFDALEG